MSIINIQPIEKSVYSDGMALDVHSIFPTIQGEGPFTGHSCVFVRLAGCNLQCPSCDTEYTDGRESMHVNEIATAVQQNSTCYDKAVKNGSPRTKDLVVITGGEPFRQNIIPLIDRLLALEYRVQIETNGTLPIPAELSRCVTVVCSPKTPKISASAARRADHFKYVAAADDINIDDGLPNRVLGQERTAAPVARPPAQHWNKVYLQPMDPHDDAEYMRNVKAVVASCMEHNHILQLQTHKIVGVE